MKIKLVVFKILLFTSVVILQGASPASAAFISNELMDDAVFSNSNSMTAAQIDTFLNSQQNSCISTNSGFEAAQPTGYTPAGGFTFGGYVTAGQVIATAAQVYELNPRVLITTLEKEQSLVTGQNSTTYCLPSLSGNHKFAAAAGYGCPDSITTHSYTGLNLYRRNGVIQTEVNPTCVNSSIKAGFSQQVIRAAWLLKFGEQRSKGNTSWNIQKPSWDNSDDPLTCYGGPMTQGNRKRCSSDASTVFYDGYTTIDGVSTHMDTGTTAALYWYTPHFHGNQLFVSIYEGWFDSTLYLDASTIIANIPVIIVSQPYSTPAVGQKVDYVVSFKNNFSFQITLDSVGVVGRASNINRDFGWQGPITLQPGASQQFTFTSTTFDTGNISMWPALLYQGNYVQYNNWGSTIVSHTPNLTLSQPLSVDAATIYAGQNVTFSSKLKNNEPFPINYDAIGIPVKFYDRYNYDAIWVGPGQIAAGAELPISGVRNIDKPGPFTYWVSDYFGGTYTTIGAVKRFDSQVIAPNFSVSGITLTNTVPARGENLGASFAVTNNLPFPIDVDAVGVVGRFGTFSGPNRDLGWQGPVHFNANETKTFTGFSRTISDVGVHYYWIGILYKGSYLQYNNWGSTIVSHEL